jgi:hypothetical protein
MGLCRLPLTPSSIEYKLKPRSASLDVLADARLFHLDREAIRSTIPDDFGALLGRAGGDINSFLNTFASVAPNRNHPE